MTAEIHLAQAAAALAEADRGLAQAPARAAPRALGTLGTLGTLSALQTRDGTQARTASYAQVGQPICRGAAGRWKRYEEQLAPIRPILEPWIRRLGYEI